MAVGVGLLVFGALICVLFIGAEPSYQGRPESYWLRSLGKSGADKIPELLGTNTVPVLLKALRARDGGLRAAYLGAWSKFPGWMQRAVSAPVPARSIRYNAATLLVAAQQFDLIFHELETNPDPDVRVCMISSLVNDGRREVTLALVRALEDGDESIRGMAALGLGYKYRPDKDLAVPALLKHIHETNEPTRALVVRCLGMVPEQSNVIVPELRRILEEKGNPRIRGEASLALKSLTHPPVPPGRTN